MIEVAVTLRTIGLPSLGWIKEQIRRMHFLCLNKRAGIIKKTCY